MKTNAIDLTHVTQAREALASAECALLAMRERLSAAEEQADARQAEQQGLELARRQAVIAGSGEIEALEALNIARAASADARERVEMLAEVVRDPERDVLEAENDLLESLEAARFVRFQAAKKELVTAILKTAPEFQSAALGIGMAWPTPGRMLDYLGENDIGPLWVKVQPPASLAGNHKSATLTEEQRRAAR
jgi:anaerobic glycerol-3-phosphate dehydrogenase